MTAGTPPGSPSPLQFHAHVVFAKEDVFEVCGALALAEAVLRRCGRPLEAARMGEVFSLAEAGLAGPAPLAQEPAVPGSNSMAREFTQ